MLAFAVTLSRAVAASRTVPVDVTSDGSARAGEDDTAKERDADVRGRRVGDDGRGGGARRHALPGPGDADAVERGSGLDGGRRRDWHGISQTIHPSGAKADVPEAQAIAQLVLAMSTAPRQTPGCCRRGAATPSARRDRLHADLTLATRRAVGGATRDLQRKAELVMIIAAPNTRTRLAGRKSGWGGHSSSDRPVGRRIAVLPSSAGIALPLVRCRARWR